jgi:hypothetical protein
MGLAAREKCLVMINEDVCESCKLYLQNISMQLLDLDAIDLKVKIANPFVTISTG